MRTQVDSIFDFWVLEVSDSLIYQEIVVSLEHAYMHAYTPQKEKEIFMLICNN